MASEESFQMAVPTSIEPDQTLLVGLSNLGLGGVTAAEYLVRHLDSDPIGHVSPDVLPAITPFEEGVPRHHTRLFNLVDHDLIVLVGELFVPVPAARAFADTLTEWIDAQAMDEVAILHGVPYPHDEAGHAVFYVATEQYRDRRLADTDLEPLSGGFLDGVPGEFISRRLDGDGQPTGVFVTPTHPPGPDIEAAFRFLDAIETVYDVSVDRTALEERGAELEQYYAELADRLATLEREASGRDFPEDRMYM